MEVIKSNINNPEEYYGQDPYEFMTKLYNVQPSRTYPIVTFPVDELGFLLPNMDYKKRI
jgi:hypothetical protein